MKRTSDNVLIGVVSFGAGDCASPYNKGVYGRVSSVRSWIQQHASV